MKKIEKIKIEGIETKGKWHDFAQESIDDIYELKLKINEIIDKLNNPQVHKLNRELLEEIIGEDEKCKHNAHIEPCNDVEIVSKNQLRAEQRKKLDQKKI